MLAPGVASRRLGFGCAGLLQEPSASKRQRLLAEAFEQGINHFDVARMYGLGAVEAEVGRFARARRESVAIATKFGIEPVAAAGRLAALQGPARRMLARYPALRDRVRRGADVFNAPRSYDGAAARTSLHKSLRELQTDYVDLLLVHDPAPGDPVDLPSICAYLEEAHQAGQVRAWGVAGERDPCVQLTRQMPAPAILQIRDDILLRSEPWPQELEPVITFGVLAGALERISGHLKSSPERCLRWSEALGTDCSSSPTLVALLLADALDANPRGVVLYSTTRPERLAGLGASALGADAVDAQTLAVFRDHVRRELSAT